MNKYLSKNNPAITTAFKLYSKFNLEQSIGWVSSITTNEKNVKLVHEINLLAIYILMENR